MSNSVYMDIPLPIPGQTADLTASEMIVEAIEIIDVHNHTDDKGIQIPVAGLNINDDLSMNSFGLIDANSIQLEALTSALNDLIDAGKVYNLNGDLYYTNGEGVVIQITSGSGLNVAASNGIGGDYGTPGVTATVNYSDLLSTYVFLKNAGLPANITCGSVEIQSQSNTSTAKLLPNSTMSTGYSIYLPKQLPTENQLIRFNDSGEMINTVIQGTSNQITVSHTQESGVGYITISLPTTINATTGNITTINSTTVNSTTVNTNIINETTSGAGVTIDGLLIKDGTITSPSLITPSLGIPTSGSLVNCISLPIVDGTTGTLSVARGGTGVTNKTGSGNVVMSDNPTITSPTFTGNPGGTIASGYYTPSITIISGASGYSLDTYWHYTRIGGIVTVQGNIALTATTSNPEFVFTLPLTPANFSASNHPLGVVQIAQFSYSSGYLGGYIGYHASHLTKGYCITYTGGVNNSTFRQLNFSYRIS